jgi:hypothetical protein
VHAILSGRDDWKALQRQRGNLTKAEQQYRADPQLAANLEKVGWSAKRVAAARAGKAIMVDPQPAAPVLGLTRLIEQTAGPQIRLSPWSEFANLRRELDEEERILKLRSFPEIRAQARQRESELLEAVLRTPPADADGLLEELQDLLWTHLDVAGVAQMRDVLRLPRPDRLDLPGMVRTAMHGRSLLEPLSEEEAEAEGPRVILRRPPPGGHPAVQVPNRHMRAPEDPGPVQRVGAAAERRPPIQRRTPVPGHKLENPTGPRVPPPTDPDEVR